MQLNTLISHHNLAVVTYDSRGRRLPLTTSLIARWIGKCAHAYQQLLFSPADSVQVHLPAHWRSIVWTHGAWYAGIPTDGAEQSPSSSAIVSDQLDILEAHDAEIKIAQSLDHLAVRWPGDLPWEIEDGAQLANEQPDSLPSPARISPEHLFSPSQLSEYLRYLDFVEHLPTDSIIWAEMVQSPNAGNQLSLFAAALWQVFTPDHQQLIPPLVLLPPQASAEKKAKWLRQESLGKDSIQLPY